MNEGRPVNLQRFLARALTVGLLILSLLLTERARAAVISGYFLHTGAPASIKNFVNPQAGCDWTGVGGQVFSSTGVPQNGLIIRVTGVLDGRSINQTAVTGGSAQFGPGGFHIQLGNRPAASASLRLQVEDSTRRPLSYSFRIPMVNNCNRNLTVANLIYRNYTEVKFLPWVLKR